MWHVPHSFAHPLLRRVCCCHPYCITHYCPGCVAATLIDSLCRVCCCYPYSMYLWVCCCHPYYSHVAWCVAATLYYVRVHPTTIVPFTAKQLRSSVVFILHAFLSDKVVNVICCITCTLCKKRYTGETGRIQTRIQTSRLTLQSP